MLRALLERNSRIPRHLERIEVLDELSVPVGEHGVVEGVLRIEVPVERGLAHPDLTGQRMQRDPGDAVLPASFQAQSTIPATRASRRLATVPVSAAGRLSITDRRISYQ